jgi:ABC-type xylose transport system substrate-binding protein
METSASFEARYAPLPYPTNQVVHAQDSTKLLIGFSFEAMKGERWQTDLNSFEARAKELAARGATPTF